MKSNVKSLEYKDFSAQKQSFLVPLFDKISLEGVLSGISFQAIIVYTQNKIIFLPDYWSKDYRFERKFSKFTPFTIIFLRLIQALCLTWIFTIKIEQFSIFMVLHSVACWKCSWSPGAMSLNTILVSKHV